MAKPPGEYQKAYRQRLKLKMKAAPDQTVNFLRRPLSDFMATSSLVFPESLDSLGVHIDGDLADDAQSIRSVGLGQLSLPGLERLEGLAGAFLDAAMELHVLINEHKAQEARNRLAEMGDRTLADPEARAQAIADAVRLNSILAGLSKSTRRDFPVIEVKEAWRQRD